VLCGQPDPDYGIDLLLRAVAVDSRRRRDVSVQLDLQLRSTTRANLTESAVAYDLNVDTYNDLRIPGACPRILVVLVLPERGTWGQCKLSVFPWARVASGEFY